MPNSYENRTADLTVNHMPGIQLGVFLAGILCKSKAAFDIEGGLHFREDGNSYLMLVRAPFLDSSI